MSDNINDLAVSIVRYVYSELSIGGSWHSSEAQVIKNVANKLRDKDHKNLLWDKYKIYKTFGEWKFTYPNEAAVAIPDHIVQALVEKEQL